jgi:hypothetical protein
VPQLDAGASGFFAGCKKTFLTPLEYVARCDMKKEVEIKARVTKEVRDAMQSIADERGEGISVIVREAFTAYLKKRSFEEAGTRDTARAGGLSTGSTRYTTDSAPDPKLNEKPL